MQKLSNILFVVGLLVVAYACFSAVYGQQGVAFKTFRSSTVILLGYFIILLSIFSAVKELNKK
ncbi:MAG: hypothetical protein FJZ10_02040 [Candidatus Omnitrophica bacterium]|nr:hypothetical protein [Candidatus Omnitrophota bacterium]